MNQIFICGQWGRCEKPVSNSSLDNDLFFQLSFSQLKKYIFPCTLLVCVNEWIKSWYWGGAFEINFNLSLGNDFTFELWYYSLNQIYQSQIACKLVLEDFKYLHSYPELHMITFSVNYEQLWITNIWLTLQVLSKTDNTLLVERNCSLCRYNSLNEKR